MSLVMAVNGIFKPFLSPHGASETNIKEANLEAPSRWAAQRKEGHNAYRKASKKIKKPRTNIFAQDIMVGPVHNISPDESPTAAMRTMTQLGVHHLLVMRGGVLAGIVSDRDLLKAIYGESDRIKTVEEIMTSKVFLCMENTEIRLIATVMLEKQISGLPVINDENLIQGIVTRTDLLECIVNNMPLEIWI